ncbi:hypothetical protein [Rubellicoccus peritrichatus]|uniref:Uncharacterized protein n=1 Tax=Rubellicoccus peritrichatus TaxID=3080537 RepID=A0AAQ3QT97_9BACT|nr:hypothetical protein [Puniceicoccus sp. CR14]WOO41086.1 hypothetical protein RZN69_20900 [Puniceicoccus sp. CR14]
MSKDDEYDDQMAFPFAEGKAVEKVNSPAPAPSSDFLGKILKEVKKRNESPAMKRIIDATNKSK